MYELVIILGKITEVSITLGICNNANFKSIVTLIFVIDSQVIYLRNLMCVTAYITYRIKFKLANLICNNV